MTDMPTPTNAHRAARRVVSIAVGVALALIAAACAEDDPIGAFAETVCDLQPSGGSNRPSVSEADDHDDDADDHDDAAEAHDDESLIVDYVVEMDMLEFGYSCTLPTLEAGTVLQLDMTNVGAVEHEAVFGDLDAQRQAEAEMAAAADDDHGDDDRGADDHTTPSLVLAAGESGTIVVTLDEPGDLIIGCHVPGHWDAGMRSDFTVTT